MGNNALCGGGSRCRIGACVADSKSEVLGATIEGEAREAGEAFARRALAIPARGNGGAQRCIVGGGETTVTVRGTGVGSRNLPAWPHAALSRSTARPASRSVRSAPMVAMAPRMPQARSSTARLPRELASAAGTDLAGDHSRNNDTLRALDSTRAPSIRTGPTGTQNVMDVQIATVA